MNVTEIKLQCLRLAVDQPGNNNTMEEAQRFYDWVSDYRVKNTDEADPSVGTLSQPRKANKK